MQIRVPTTAESETVASELLRPFYRTEVEHDPDYHAIDEDWVADAGIDRWLDAEDHAIFVAEAESGELVGIVTGRRSEQPPLFDREPVLVVDGLYVRPSFRDRGIASSLLDRIESWGRDHGCAHVGLTVHANNHAAIDRYEDRGYEFAYRGYHREL